MREQNDATHSGSRVFFPQERGLLAIEADPLPIQFTGMTGSAGHGPPGMPAIGGAFGGDWNANGGVSPEHAHWPARTPTWIRLKAAPPAPADDGGGSAGCTGFVTLLHPRHANATTVRVSRVEELAGASSLRNLLRSLRISWATVC